jgi:hypothetical protein
MKTHSFTPASLRRAHIDLLSDGRFTHAVTLNADRELAAARLRSIFGTFCMNVDRAIHSKQRVSKIPSHQRFLAIAWPENLDTNAHLHVAADLSAFAAHGRDADARALESIWHKATHGAGSVHVKRMTTQGWAAYMTKKANWSDPVYFISTDFHPN